MRGRFGWRLTDLAEFAGMPKTTAHRLLKRLVAERLATQTSSDRHFFLGPLPYELGLSGPALDAVVKFSLPALDRLARNASVVAYLFMRSGDDFVCAARAGILPIKALSIEIGTRRPLISSAGGNAILAALPAVEARKVIARNLEDVQHYGPQRVRALQSVARESRKLGYGIHRGQIVPGVQALGVAVTRIEGDPAASVSLVGPAEAFAGENSTTLLALLEKEAAAIEQEFRRLRL
jgi:DNA-binding IclR family transcriptional regulator